MIDEFMETLLQFIEGDHRLSSRIRYSDQNYRDHRFVECSVCGEPLYAEHICFSGGKNGEESEGEEEACEAGEEGGEERSGAESGP